MVVDSIDFDVREAEILGIVGESGSGESALLRTLIGLHGNGDGGPRFRGELLPFPVARRPVSAPRAPDRVPEPGLLAQSTAHDRALHHPSIGGLRAGAWKAERRERVQSLLASGQLDAES